MHQPENHNWRIDFAAVREQVSIQDVLDLIDWTPNKRHGNQLRGPCPIHRSSSESVIFAVNLKLNAWYCHSKTCKSGGNQLDLYAAVKGLPLYRATKDLCQALNIDLA